MKKVTSFFIYKFNSQRLKDYNYNIKVNHRTGRENNEVVRMGENSLFEELLRLKKVNFDREEVEKIEKEISRIRGKKSSLSNKERLEKLFYALDKILFVDEIVSVKFNNIKHYADIVKKGLFINGVKFVRLSSSAGQARQQQALFVDEKFYDKLDYFIDGGRSKDIKITPAKYNSYFGLSSSGGMKISIPKFAVIPDYKVSRLTRVEFSTPQPDRDPIIDERIMELEFVPFDGQGLGSPSFFNSVAYELEMEYVPSSVIFRGMWLKGMIACFDFHEFARRNKVSEITDVYGKSHNIFDLDVVLTESQFKMIAGYSNFEDYLKESQDRNYAWRISRVSPKVDKNICYSNYHYVKVANFDKKDVEDLCEDTVNYFKEVSGLKYNSSLIFLLGSLSEKTVTKEWFENLEPTVKLLIHNPDLINDKFIVNKLRKLISKQIRESYIGKLRLQGNYSMMQSDNYAFAEYMFGMEVKGLLKSREFYSKYWNDRNVDKVAAFRSPMTWRSEINVLDLKRDKEKDFWYKYLDSGIVYNVHDNSTMLHAGSDKVNCPFML